MVQAEFAPVEGLGDRGGGGTTLDYEVREGAVGDKLGGDAGLSGAQRRWQPGISRERAVKVSEGEALLDQAKTQFTSPCGDVDRVLGRSRHRLTARAAEDLSVGMSRARKYQRGPRWTGGVGTVGGGNTAALAKQCGEKLRGAREQRGRFARECRPRVEVGLVGSVPDYDATCG